MSTQTETSPTQGQIEDARDKLITFLRETKVFLNLLVDSRDNLYPQELNSKINEAWSEFDASFNLNEAEALINETSDKSLKDHGLYGSQLDLKLSVINYWRQKFDFWGFWDNTKKEILKWLIDSIDTLLKSLLQAAGISGAIEELKECLSNSLDMIDLNTDE